MPWNICHDAAWWEAGDLHYRHYCGVTLFRSGRLWTGTSATGIQTSGFRTALDAVAGMATGGHGFWTLGQFSEFGVRYGQVQHRIGPVERNGYLVFTFSMLVGEEFPEFLKSVLRANFFGKARCAACSAAMSGLVTRDLRQFDRWPVEGGPYLVCHCGYPVWQMEHLTYSKGRKVLDRKRVIAAGGKHSRAEVQEILALQGNRCIYCNRMFMGDLIATKDHLLPRLSHGADWALNIVMACRSCNSSRGEIPFRTFCKLLSARQNERVVCHLGRRLHALSTQQHTKEAILCFAEALVSHDPKHPRYLDIQRIRPTARRNAKTNRLLPANVSTILRRASFS